MTDKTHPALAVLLDLGYDFDEEFDAQVIPHLLALPSDVQYGVIDPDNFYELYNETGSEPWPVVAELVNDIAEDWSGWLVDKVQHADGRVGIAFGYSCPVASAEMTHVVPV